MYFEVKEVHFFCRFPYTYCILVEAMRTIIISNIGINITYVTISIIISFIISSIIIIFGIAIGISTFSWNNNAFDFYAGIKCVGCYLVLIYRTKRLWIIASEEQWWNSSLYPVRVAILLKFN